MDVAQTTDEPLSCSFCDKTDRQAQKIITGSNVGICDECVALCIEILEVELGQEWSGPRDSDRRPVEP
jgi:ATP-dependent Clp protease ATP-binding subunit ClpX